MGDSRDDFQNWCNLWQQAQDAGIFPGEEKLQPSNDLDDEYYNEEDPMDQYYSNLDRMAEEEYDGGLLQETRKAANPIRPDSVGKDQDFPVASWTDERAIAAVTNLKRELYEIECRLNEKAAGGKKWQTKPVKMDEGSKKLWQQIESIRRKIDTLSDNLGLKDEPEGSFWPVKD